MRYSVAAPIAALCFALAPAAAAAQPDPPPLSVGRVTAQVGAGVVATPLGFVAGGLATRWVARRLGADTPAASQAAMVGAWTGAALATAAAPAAIGARGPGTGSYGAALAGALAGGAVSYALVRLNDSPDDGPARPCRVVCAVSAVAVFVLPSVGATIGFNVSRRAR